jgi:hypothetical protein
MSGVQALQPKEFPLPHDLVWERTSEPAKLPGTLSQFRINAPILPLAAPVEGQQVESSSLGQIVKTESEPRKVWKGHPVCVTSFD